MEAKTDDHDLAPDGTRPNGRMPNGETFYHLPYCRLPREVELNKSQIISAPDGTRIGHITYEAKPPQPDEWDCWWAMIGGYVGNGEDLTIAWKGLCNGTVAVYAKLTDEDGTTVTVGKCDTCERRQCLSCRPKPFPQTPKSDNPK